MTMRFSKKHIKRYWIIFAGLFFFSAGLNLWAQPADDTARRESANKDSSSENPLPASPLIPVTSADRPKPIVVTDVSEDIEKRLTRKITLDVRDMNVIDVIKFLALKG